jgi:hypothetical protein
MNIKHIKKIIDKQFKIAKLDLKYEDICEGKKPNWYREYTYTEEDNEKWKNWTINYLREKMKLTKDRALIETAWIDLNYGLRTINAQHIKKKKK